MKKYHCFCFETESQAQSEILIAQLDLMDPIGYKEEDNLLYVYFEENKLELPEIVRISEEMNVSFKVSILEEENWNANWESIFEPIAVRNPEDQSLFVYVRASFHDKNPNAEFDLEITPKMSFGTGHHATTYLMMESMKSIDFNEKKVVDFGTGTGVLAILAEKMGAEQIIAIDNDDWSLENAKENLENNFCNKSKLIKAEACESDSEFKADIILANINLNVITDNLERIKNMSKTNALVLFSGILETDIPQLSASLESKGYLIDKIKVKNGWVLIKTSLV